MIYILDTSAHYHLVMTSAVMSPGLKSSVLWRKGVQMIALKWQKCDQGMMLNEGMFVALNEIEAFGRPGRYFSRKLVLLKEVCVSLDFLQAVNHHRQYILHMRMTFQARSSW